MPTKLTKRQLHSSFSTFSTSFVTAQSAHLRHLALVLLFGAAACLLVACVGTPRLALLHVDDFAVTLWVTPGSVSTLAGDAVVYRNVVNAGLDVMGALHAMAVVVLLAALLGLAMRLRTQYQLRLSAVAAQVATLVALGDWATYADTPAAFGTRRIGPALILVTIGVTLAIASLAVVCLEVWLARLCKTAVRPTSEFTVLMRASKGSKSIHSSVLY